jgi:hypothetical protein
MPSDLLTLEEIEELDAALKGITSLPWKADNYNLYGASKRVMIAQERNLHAIVAIMNAAPALLRAARIAAKEGM